MDLFNPLSHVCRGVESDILNHLIHVPDFQNPTSIAREIRRSKSEVIKCLHLLSHHGVVFRSYRKGRWYGIDPISAIGDCWRNFALLPEVYSNELSAIVATWPETIRSVTLAHPSWAEALDTVNLLVVISEPGQFPLNHQLWQINQHAKDRFDTTVSTLHGSAAEVLQMLRSRGINPYERNWTSRTKIARHIHGEQLRDVLAEQEGFEPPGLVGRPLSRRVH